MAGLTPDWAERLLDSFVSALTAIRSEEAPAHFLSTLDEILRQVIAADGDIVVAAGAVYPAPATPAVSQY